MTCSMRPRFVLSSFCVLIFSFFLVVKPVAAMQDVPFAPAPNEFVSAIVMVPKTHEILYEYEARKIHPAASLTKLANALVFVRTKPVWNKIISLKKEDEVGGGRLRVKVGARLNLRDLLYSSITASANNAATAMMRISGKKPSVFLQEMNQVVHRLGANKSTFVDASGMDPQNVTTAYDMALIAEAAFRDPSIHAAASKGSYTFTIRNTGERKTIRNTNTLLTDDPDVWVVGGKTGYLEESKYNLVVQLRPMFPDGSSDLQKELLVVVFGAPTKEAQFTTAKRLAQWAWNQYEFPRTRKTS